MIKKNFSYRPGVLEKTDPSDGKPIYFQVWHHITFYCLLEEERTVKKKKQK